MQKDPSWNNSKHSTDVSTKPEKKEKPSTDVSTEIEFENTSGLAAKYLNMKIGDLVRVRGGVQGLKEWVGILKNLTATSKAEQEMQERRNELVEKDFMISNVKKYLDLFMSNAFDAVESQKKIISATYKADPETAEQKIEDMRKKALTKISREAVRSINDSMKSLKRKYDNDDINA